VQDAFLSGNAATKDAAVLIGRFVRQGLTKMNYLHVAVKITNRNVILSPTRATRAGTLVEMFRATCGGGDTNARPGTDPTSPHVRGDADQAIRLRQPVSRLTDPRY
jgi:hypothetical protein